eukprot:CAMPEP_0113447790 /NCGR_PEP_ID=MMETSP0014_2-20120614/4421_1 /TAXON_ID=2857 /ORGANISM="Nitzschia sp." /LENGTH=544 /DNA_ID=CAMNT_0000338959 /DNA_START=141 /DNA_END=1776 /DNA_ORIENTATION=- /assembly_acc=CAM_ASM_000159
MMVMITKTHYSSAAATAKAVGIGRRWSTRTRTVSPLRMLMTASGTFSNNIVNNKGHSKSSSFFSTNLNEDNTAQYHDHIHHHHPSSSQQQHQEWTTFNGKIPVLKTDILTQTWPSTTKTLSSSSSSSSTVSPSSEPFGYERPRVSLLISEILLEIRSSISRIESRPVHSSKNQWGQNEPVFDFALDFYGSLDDPIVQKLMSDLDPITEKLLVLDEKDVQWFPLSELDLIAHRTLDAGVDLESDHPGFNDEVYRARRAELAENAINHKWDRPIPRIEYTGNEIKTWSAVWDKMEGLWEDYACKEYLHSLDLFKMYCGYSRDNIPQQQDISSFLKQRTNFEMRPVAGLLSSRDFLNGLAFRVFFSTQYIRHHSQPLYTPEPDICHELLGHAPMFADRDFADFSQEIGLASLGASDEDVQKLAHCYWFSVEFGLCCEGGKSKAYGAGLLSSFGELEYACSPDHPGADDPPEIIDWDPEVAALKEFPITTYQPTYFLASSLGDAKQRMRQYCESLQRPFFALHNAQTSSVFIDRPVRRTKNSPKGAAK